MLAKHRLQQCATSFTQSPIRATYFKRLRGIRGRSCKRHQQGIHNLDDGSAGMDVSVDDVAGDTVQSDGEPRHPTAASSLCHLSGQSYPMISR